MFIAFEEVTYVYSPGTPWEKKALQDINLEIEQGEIVGIMGPTGSGKSTLIQHFNGLLKPTKGRVLIDGMDTARASRQELRRLRQKVGLLFQFPEHQLFEARVFDDIAYGPRNLGLSEPEVEARVRKAMEQVGLDYAVFADRSPFSLSSGQMRRTAIAGVLAMQPEVLVFDEPGAGLDPEGKRNLWQLIRELHGQRELTVIIVSHHAQELENLVSRLVVMGGGKILLDGAAEKVFSHVEELLQSGLEVPLPVEIMWQLKKRGWDIEADTLDVKTAASRIAAAWQRRKSGAASPAAGKDSTRAGG